MFAVLRSPEHESSYASAWSSSHGLKSEVGMDKALEHIGIELEGTHHRGGDDANNIAKILIHTIKKFRLNV